jgi:hypothetical protein
MLIGLSRLALRRPVAAAVALACVVTAVMVVGGSSAASAALPSVGTGDYLLSGLAGKCLDVAWGDPTTGTAVNLFTCNGTPAQRWHYDAPSGTLTALGKCLDVPGARFENRNHLWIWDCNGTNAQRFQLVSTARGYLVRPAASSGFCVEVAGGFTDDWTPVQIFDCNSTASQDWHFADQQVPDAAPVAPILSLTTVTIRDHRGGTTVTRVVPAAQLRDRALFEEGLDWYQRINGGDWTFSGSPGALSGVDGTDVNYALDDVNKRYEYKVIAHNAAGATESAVIGLPPAAPTSLSVGLLRPSSFVVGWVDNSGNEDGFQLSSTASSGLAPFPGTLTLGPNTTSLIINAQVRPATTYCFAVWAFHQAGPSGPSVGCYFVPPS